MVGPVNDDGVLVEPVLFELGDVLANPGIHRGDELVVSLPVLLHDRGGGIVRGKGVELIGVLSLAGGETFRDALVFALRGDSAFVAAGEVEDGEEGLVRVLSVLPVAFSSTDIPGLFRVFELVIFLRIVCAVVARLPEINGEGLDGVGHLRVAAHVHGADRCLIHSRDDSGAAGRAHAGGGEGVGVTHSFFGKLIEIGSDRVGVAVAAKVGPDVLGREPENVGAIRRRSDDGKKNEEEDCFHKCHESWTRFRMRSWSVKR